MARYEFLEYMARHGLDARVLQEYKQCGLIYYSKRYNARNGADINRFVDFTGVDRKLIRRIDDLENELCICIYHIIWNSDNEIILMFYDPELDIGYQMDKFKTGYCTAIRYLINEDEWEYRTLHYEVRLGAVVDMDFDSISNM